MTRYNRPVLEITICWRYRGRAVGLGKRSILPVLCTTPAAVCCTRYGSRYTERPIVADTQRANNPIDGEECKNTEQTLWLKVVSGRVGCVEEKMPDEMQTWFLTDGKQS